MTFILSVLNLQSIVPVLSECAECSQKPKCYVNCSVTSIQNVVCKYFIISALKCMATVEWIGCIEGLCAVIMAEVISCNSLYC